MAESLGLHEVYTGGSPVVEYVFCVALLVSALSTLTSIVAVHGLNGVSARTWTTNKTNNFWLGDADMLPTNLKNARILTFGYDAAVTALFGKTSSDRILQHAHTLVAELVADRQVRQSS